MVTGPRYAFSWSFIVQEKEEDEEELTSCSGERTARSSSADSIEEHSEEIDALGLILMLL